MSLTSCLLGISLMAPLQCALWHGARLGRWPGNQTPLTHRAAHFGGWECCCSLRWPRACRQEAC